MVSAQGDEATRTVAIAELDATVDLLAQDALRPTRSLHDDLRPLAPQYERLRRDPPSGAQRTSAMTRLVNQARVRAAAPPDAARSLGRLQPADRSADRAVGERLPNEIRTCARDGCANRSGPHSHCEGRSIL